MTAPPDTIAAIATPFGQGAISLIRVSGPQAAEVVSQAFRVKRQGGGEAKVSIAKLTPRRATFGSIVAADGGVIDEILCTFFPDPHSYTGEDLVEISGHGGVLVTRLVLERLLACGARSAEPGEFSQRAFLNGKMDLTQAEAVMDLISAQTELALRAANEQLAGRLGERLMGIREDLISIVAHLEAYIDFPEEDIDPETGQHLAERIHVVTASIQDLVDTADQGRILREGVRTVICGAPNVGKSSLLNVLLGFERAIVSETAGTTRDTIEEVINLRGIPLRLVDTAGVRESEDAIEREGIDRARRQIETAELILEVVDASLGREAQGLQPVSVPSGAHHIRVLNKLDLGVHPDWRNGSGNSESEAGYAEVLEVPFSCKTLEGQSALCDRIVAELSSGGAAWSSEMIAVNARHKNCLVRAEEFLTAAEAQIRHQDPPEIVAIELRSALDAVGEVVGKADVEEILGEIFSTFCIGK